MSKTKQKQVIDLMSSEFQTRLDYDGSDNLIYVGKARCAMGTSVAEWQIQKLVYTGGNVSHVMWADGDQEYDNIWDNRTSLTYS